MKLLLTTLLSMFLLNTASAQHFNTGSVVATEELKQELQKFYKEKIKDKKIDSIVIEGHTDIRGSDIYNLNLSKKRANTALEELKKLGLKNDNIITKGLGESNPISEEHGENRRIVLIVKSEDGDSVTVIKECKPTVKEVYKKNALKLFLGYGPNEIHKKNGRKAELDDDPMLGIGYQRMINKEVSLEVLGTTSETLLIGAGYHF
jgi:hypothetical protein